MHSAANTMRRAVAAIAPRGTRATTIATAQTHTIRLLPVPLISATRRPFSSANIRRSSAVDAPSASSAAASAAPSSPASASSVPAPPFRVVLFASSSFSLPTLRALTSSPDVIRTSELIVVTPADKVRGRGRELRESEFKREAKRLLAGADGRSGGSSRGHTIDSPSARGCVIDLPADINFKMDGWELPQHLIAAASPSAAASSSVSAPSASPSSSSSGPAFDVGVVVSFGYMLPARLLRQFRFGVLNIHPSLLPRHRGSAPIQFAIARGEPVTGVSVIDVHPTRMDGGDVISQHTAAMQPADEPTYESMHDPLAEQGAQQLMHVLRNMQQARASRKEQTELASAASAVPVDSSSGSAVTASSSPSAVPSLGSIAPSLPFICPSIPPQVPSLAPRIPKHAGDLLWALHGALRLSRIFRALKGFTPIYSHFKGARIEIKDVLDPREAARRIQAAAAAESAGSAGSTPADFSFFPNETEARNMGAGGLFFHGGLRALGVLCSPSSSGSSNEGSTAPLEVLYVTELHLANKPQSVSAETFAFGYLDKRVLTEPAQWAQWKFVCSADLPATKGQDSRKTLSQLDYWSAKLK